MLSILIGPDALEGVRLFSGVTGAVSHKHSDRMSMSHKHFYKNYLSLVLQKFVSHHINIEVK